MSPRELPLSGKKAAGRVALVDAEEYDRVAVHRWRVREQQRKPGRRPSGPYAATGVATVYLHTFITGWARVDHRNGNGLDCTWANMREATNAQNQANAGSRGGSSRFKGVYWDRRRKKWRAQIFVSRRGRYLGSFTDEVAAALAYDAAAWELYGEFARPNFPAFCTACLSRPLHSAEGAPAAAWPEGGLDMPRRDGTAAGGQPAGAVTSGSKGRSHRYG